jgi:putative peptide maturation dehydrogenase
VPRFRRTVYAFFAWHDGTFLDLENLFRGEVMLSPQRQLLAISVLRGEPVPVSAADVELLGAVPSDRWVDSAEVVTADDGQLDELARAGLLVSDDDEPTLAELRQRDEHLAEGQWNVYAAVYHALTRWHGVEVRKPFGDGPGELSDFVGQYGMPPPAFHTAASNGPVQALRPPERNGSLFELLGRRRTTRAFDPESTLTAEELSTVLHQVFGCHGYAPVVEDVVALKRTSPSGGSLHPIEAYPLLLRVEGYAPGLYHYRAQDHSLQLLEALGLDEAERLASDFTCGQSYFASGAALFVLTARFYRNFWKYRRHQKAYSVVLMDAGHLSQTLYLVCAELGLGAFVTATVNAADVEERLRLDPFVEGAIAITGCGRPAPGGSPLEPSFLPHLQG